MSSRCKLCGERSDLVNAHIVPRSFYPERGRSKEGLLVLGSNPNERQRRSRTGLYDKNLVCKQCERKFGPFDDYAAKTLRDRAAEFQEITERGETLLFVGGDFDYSKMKLFALSLLWRAAASQKKEFKGLDVGPILPSLAEMVRNEEPGDPEIFSTFFGRFVDVEDWQTGFISPLSEQYEGVSFVRFVMGLYVAYVKVDEQETPDFLSGLILRPGTKLTIIAREFHGGPEFRAFSELVRKNAARRKAPAK